MKNCIFCKIINGELPVSKIYEDDEVMAFMDIQPINKGHVLVIPKIHKQLITELDDHLVKKLMVIAKNINKAIRKSNVKSQAVNPLLSDGEAAGQEVYHVHLHVVPRFEGDGFGFNYPAGFRDKTQREELEAIAHDIRSNVEID